MGGVFGGGGSAPTYDGSAYSTALTNIGNNLGTLYNQLGTQYQTDQAAANRANTAYSQYLQSNPATNTYNAGQVAGAEKGASEAAQAAKANLSMDLARRGISPNSSMGVGGLASINQGLAANDANIRAQVAQNNENRYQQNLATNAALQTGLANTGFGQMSSTAGQQAGIESNLLNNAQQVYQDELNAYNSQNAAQSGLWGALAGAAATAFGKH